MAFSRLERVWRGWLRLNEHDRAAFLNRFRAACWQERQERLLANRGAEPVSAEPLARVSVGALDFDAGRW